MKNNNDVQNHANVDGLLESNGNKGTEPMLSVLPGINRLIEDLRSGYQSGSRINVIIDWAQGRMALSH